MALISSNVDASRAVARRPARGGGRRGPRASSTLPGRCQPAQRTAVGRTRAPPLEQQHGGDVDVGVLATSTDDRRHSSCRPHERVPVVESGTIDAGAIECRVDAPDESRTMALETGRPSVGVRDATSPIPDGERCSSRDQSRAVGQRRRRDRHLEPCAAEHVDDATMLSRDRRTQAPDLGAALMQAIAPAIAAPRYGRRCGPARMPAACCRVSASAAGRGGAPHAAADACRASTSSPTTMPAPTSPARRDGASSGPGGSSATAITVRHGSNRTDPWSSRRAVKCVRYTCSQDC